MLFFIRRLSTQRQRWSVVFALLFINICLFVYFVFFSATAVEHPLTVASDDRVVTSIKIEKETAVKTEAPTEFAFLTLCTNIKTLPAVLVQLALLRKFKTKHHLLVMITEKTPELVKSVLEGRGAQVVRMESVPYNFIGAPSYARGKWKEAVVKLRMFQMNYEKMVFLDADVLVQANVDELFDIQIEDDGIVGSLDLHDCVGKETYKGFKKLNTGVLLFHPSLSNWNKLMTNYKNAPQRGNWMSDQDLIEDTFKAKTDYIPERIATLFVQCKCERDLNQHKLVHGAGFLPADALSLYGMKNEGSMLECATTQYKLWVDTYYSECGEVERWNLETFNKMKQIGYCDPSSPYPGKDAAWLRIKDLEKL